MLVMVATVTRTMTVQSTIRSAKSTADTERVRTVSVSKARRSNRPYVAGTIKPFALNFMGFFYRLQYQQQRSKLKAPEDYRTVTSMV
jgi:hypothetical protein